MGTARMMGLHSIYLGLTGEGLNSGSNAVAGIAISQQCLLTHLAVGWDLTWNCGPEHLYMVSSQHCGLGFLLRSNSGLYYQCSREPATCHIAFYGLVSELYSRSYIASLLLYRSTSLYCGSNPRGGTQIHLSVGEVSQNLQTCFKTTTLIQQIVSSPLCPGTVLRTSQQAVIEILNFSSSLQYIWT